MSSQKDNELLAAYLDGVAELGADERQRVDELLREHPEARAEAVATHDMIDRLRALRASPGEARDPDWSALERRLRAEVGDEAPRRWWRSSWLGPIGALAATATIAVLWLHHPAPESRELTVTAPHVEAPVTAPEPATATALWLDGQAFEIDDVDPAVLDDSHDALAAGPELDDELGILPVDDLGWVDTLDDTAVERAEHWLARKKG